MHTHNDRYKEELQELVATFISLESNRQSLITVTDLELTEEGARAILRVSVYPEDREATALDFLKRKRSECREYLKEHGALHRIPTLDFEIDMGEKERRRIDELLK